MSRGGTTRMLLATWAAFALIADCSPTERVIGGVRPDGGSCDPTECDVSCTAQGFGNGTCAGSLCLCVPVSADADADADADGDEDADAADEVEQEAEPTSAGIGRGTDNPFGPTDENSESVAVRDESLVLEGSGMALQYLWVPNSGEGTVSKIDTLADPPLEVGRYYVGLDADNADPSRTSVDMVGDAFIANRAANYPCGSSGNRSSVTKIAAESGRCVDRNGDGDIDTSTGSAPMPRSTSAASGVPVGQSTDECVLWTRDLAPGSGPPVGTDPDLVAPEGCTRARAIAANQDRGLDYTLNGNVWVGCYNQQRAYLLEGSTGRVLDSVAAGCPTYGFLVDDGERLWIDCLGELGLGPGIPPRVYDPAARAFTVLPELKTDPGWPYGDRTYGFALGGTREHREVWTTTWWTEMHGHVWRHTDERGWEYLVGPAGIGPGTNASGRGIAVDGDGFVWAVHSEPPQVWLIDPAIFPAAGAVLEVLPAADGTAVARATNATGIAVDFEENVWVVTMGEGAAAACSTSNGYATRYVVDRSDPAHPRVEPATHPERVFSIEIGTNPYVYSDMIGYHLRRHVVPEGWYRQTFETCPGRSVRWNRILWDATVPEGTSIVILGRTADHRVDLPGATWVVLAQDPPDTSPRGIPVGTPPAGLADGHFIELEIHLYADPDDRTATPAVASVRFDWECTYELY